MASAEVEQTLRVTAANSVATIASCIAAHSRQIVRCCGAVSGEGQIRTFCGSCTTAASVSECVSPGEVARVLEVLPSIDRKRILFTPNFAPRTEYEQALEQGVWVTFDNLFPLKQWAKSFKGSPLSSIQAGWSLPRTPYCPRRNASRASLNASGL